MKIFNKLLGFFLISGIIVLSVYKWYPRTTKNDLVIINVLDEKLYNDCHIRGSINVPFENVKEYASTLNKNTHVVFYCSNYMCTASGEAARMLKKMGFENVWAYEAGIAEWFQNNLPVEGCPKEQAYLNKKIEKPNTNEGDLLITTEQLKNKMKKMLHINSI